MFARLASHYEFLEPTASTSVIASHIPFPCRRSEYSMLMQRESSSRVPVLREGNTRPKKLHMNVLFESHIIKIKGPSKQTNRPPDTEEYAFSSGQG